MATPQPGLVTHDQGLPSAQACPRLYQPDSHNPLHVQVRAEDDEGLQVDEVDLPGVDPADVTSPWSLLLTNHVSVVANDETLVDITFAAGSTISTSGTGRTAAPAKSTSPVRTLLSAAVMAKPRHCSQPRQRREYHPPLTTEQGNGSQEEKAALLA
ncbi:MAG TPA: hypothetical protein VKB88_40700 [Bryobacteraceae bacterium]|nr:hypothetical protein [Bryobacteraceae bacterium]